MTAHFTCNASGQASRHLNEFGNPDGVGGSGGGGCSFGATIEVPTAMSWSLSAGASGDGTASYAFGGASGNTGGSSGPHSGTLQPGFYSMNAGASAAALATGGVADDFMDSESAQVTFDLSLTP